MELFCFRYLASGNSQISLAVAYRMSPASISIILKECMAAICKTMGPENLPKPTAKNFSEIAEDYEKKWQFPNCFGALDGKHIRVKAFNNQGSLFYNYKGFHSIILLGLVDANYKFTLVDIGSMGSQSDGGIFAKSKISKQILEQKDTLPNSKLFGDKLLPPVIIADDAFPLKSTIMKPYPGKYLTEDKRIFNYR